MTECLIGFENPINGSVKFVYCNVGGDGHVPETLATHYCAEKKAFDLVEKGHIRELGKTITETEFYKDCNIYHSGELGNVLKHCPYHSIGNFVGHLVDAGCSIRIYMYRGNGWIEIIPNILPPLPEVPKVAVSVHRASRKAEKQMYSDLLKSELQQLDKLFAEQTKNKIVDKADSEEALLELAELRKALKDATTEQWNAAIKAGLIPDGSHGFKLPDGKR